MFQHYTFHPSLVLRTPALPFPNQFGPDFIQTCLSDCQFMEALYLASPDLHQECIKWQNGALTDPKKIGKLLITLTKYYSRAASRCTPFGLFAGCSVINWGDKNDIRLEESASRRHTRLDMQYLCALAHALSQKEYIRDELRYFPNSSLYAIRDEVRYIEYTYEGNCRVHQISSVMESDYLTQVLANCTKGLKPVAIAAQLCSEEVDFDEAYSFVDQLIEAHVLVSELEPAITGKEFLHQIMEVLAQINTTSPHPEIGEAMRILQEVDRQLRLADHNQTRSTDDYEKMARLLQPLGVPIERNRLFQTDKIQPTSSSSLDPAWQQDLLEALTILSRISPKAENARLTEFKRKFYERYEDKEVPLLEVLDTESGICYNGQSSAGNTPLVEDIDLPTPAAEEQVIHQGNVEQFMYQKLCEAEKSGKQTIEITTEEVVSFLPSEKLLPPSLSILFRIIDSKTILLENAGGASAINLLSRFAHADPALLRVVEQIARTEQYHNPDILFAEIIHLPESRVGNILLRPVVRDYEIPYLSKSALPADQQIALQDLVVSVRRNQIVLRSKRLNKIIIPRLSTAHNYAYQSMPIYHFLCDLQTDELQGSFSFSWETFCPQRTFFPRLTHRNVILHAAAWQLNSDDFGGLLTCELAELARCFLAFRQRWQLPRFFTLADQDNELLVDSENLLTVQALVSTIKGRPTIRLKEFLFRPDESIVTDGQGRPYVNQFLAPLVRTNTCYRSFQTTSPATATPCAIQREFSLGSEWLYYKFYSGVQTADRILLEAIKPMTEELLKEKLIDKWFFIRYTDPDPHLRVRLHLPDASQIGRVIQLVNRWMQPYMQAGCIWKSQVDTYRREVERYGSQTMELAETLFFVDSTAVLEMMEQTNNMEGEHTRWICGIKAVDELLQVFEFSLLEKRNLLEQLKLAFAKEFGLDKDLKLQLDQKYRQHCLIIQKMMKATRQTDDEHTLLLVTLHQQQQQTAALLPFLRERHEQNPSEVSWNGMVTSFIHMLLNRLIPTNQRLHELVIYDFLFRQYQSEVAKQKVACSEKS